MLKTLFLLFSIINLSNSFFNFTIDLYRDKPFFPWEVIKEELTFKSTTELDVVVFFFYYFSSSFSHFNSKKKF